MIDSKSVQLISFHSSATIGLRPEMFNEISEGLVIYAEKIESGGKLRGVLISDSRDDAHKK